VVRNNTARIPSAGLGGLLVVLALLAGCAGLPATPVKVASQALVDTSGTRLAKAIEPNTQGHGGEAGVVALADGHDAFASRVLLARAAERSIDLQTYIFHADATGMLMFDELRRAADRGVRVRLLLDDNNTAGMDPLLALVDAHPNIELRLFNPFAYRGSRLVGYATDFSRLNRRMHNKSFTADNQATIVGGRNIGDEYFAAGQGTSFADLDVIAVGDVVREVSTLFDRYWNSASAYPAASLLGATEPMTETAFRQQVEQVRDSAEAAEYVQALQRSPQVQDLLAGRSRIEWAAARLVFDEPEKVLNPPERVDLQLLPKLQEAFGGAQSGVDLVSPYFVPGDTGAEALETLARRGVQVRVLTNSLAATDVAAVHAGYAKRRKDLLRAGVRLFELKPTAETAAARRSAGSGGGAFGGSSVGGSSKSSLHAKTFSVDRRRVFVGSFNLDPRSARLNTEMGMVIDSPRLAGELSTALDRIAPEKAYEVKLSPEGQLQWLDNGGVVHTTEPQSGLVRRGLVEVFSWLPIEWLL
jgi:putative cardiolipin synthase